jgi:hypothetical protein
MISHTAKTQYFSKIDPTQPVDERNKILFFRIPKRKAIAAVRDMRAVE